MSAVPIIPGTIPSKKGTMGINGYSVTIMPFAADSVRTIHMSIAWMNIMTLWKGSK